MGEGASDAEGGQWPRSSGARGARGPPGREGAKSDGLAKNRASLWALTLFPTNPKGRRRDKVGSACEPHFNAQRAAAGERRWHGGAGALPGVVRARTLPKGSAAKRVQL